MYKFKAYIQKNIVVFVDEWQRIGTFIVMEVEYGLCCNKT